MSETITTAEVVNVLSLSGSGVHLYGFTVQTDRKILESGKLSKGRKLGAIVGNSLPSLLRDVANLIEQNEGTWEGLVKVLDEHAEGRTKKEGS